MGPVSHDTAHPFAESLYLKDPSGNSLELCVWRDPAKTNRAAAVGIGRIPNSGLAHCVFDVTDVEKAEDFYVKALGVDRSIQGSQATA